jgi:hypothetical protein
MHEDYVQRMITLGSLFVRLVSAERFSLGVVKMDHDAPFLSFRRLVLFEKKIDVAQMA